MYEYTFIIVGVPGGRLDGYRNYPLRTRRIHASNAIIVYKSVKTRTPAAVWLHSWRKLLRSSVTLRRRLSFRRVRFSSFKNHAVVVYNLHTGCFPFCFPRYACQPREVNRGRGHTPSSYFFFRLVPVHSADSRMTSGLGWDCPRPKHTDKNNRFRLNGIMGCRRGRIHRNETDGTYADTCKSSGLSRNVFCVCSKSRNHNGIVARKGCTAYASDAGFEPVRDEWPFRGYYRNTVTLRIDVYVYQSLFEIHMSKTDRFPLTSLHPFRTSTAW